MFKKKEQSKETIFKNSTLFFFQVFKTVCFWDLVMLPVREQDGALCAVTALAYLPQLGGEDEPRLVLDPVVPRAVQVLTSVRKCTALCRSASPGCSSSVSGM
jgi:hypothetical protein